jgi:hypothetical protein
LRGKKRQVIDRRDITYKSAILIKSTGDLEMNKLLTILLSSTLMVGCATNWSHPTADQYRFQMDIAQCEMYAQAAVPDTSSPINPYLTPSQQAAQNASNAGSQLGRSLGLRSQFNNCMISKGYRK